MKKLLIIMTLFMSSFFLPSLKDVKAIELTLDLSFELIDDTFLEIKNAADDFLENNSDGYDNYIIAYKSGYYVYYFKDSSSSSLSCNIYNDNITCPFYEISYKYTYSSSSLVFLSTSTNFGAYDYSSNFNNILYSTFVFIHNRGYATDIINLNYSGNTKQILYEETLPLVYDLYLEVNSPVEEDIPEELENVTSFYTMVIEKISYFAEQVANNYILLSILGIFIIIFVFELIFRRFL